MAAVRARPNLRLSIPTETNTCPRFSFPVPLTTSLSIINTPQTIQQLSDLDVLEVLGQGNSGTVYRIIHKVTSDFYALKIIRSDCDPIIRRQSLREIEILRCTRSPYIVQCDGVFEKACGDIAIALELMDAGSLDYLLKTNGSFTEKLLSKIAGQVLKGLNYLHVQKIVHRDIKPANILVNKKMEVKIADFGCSRIMCRMLDTCDTFIGTRAYMSPERYDPSAYGGNYNGYAGDVWSLGLTIAELFLGYYPLLPPGENPDWITLMCAICSGEPLSLPETSTSPEFRDFIGCCLHKDFSKRWTVSQLLSHPFVSQDLSL
ncbi:hypothetical protein GIB67_036178 [Kingdonia uniflora]|uniref:mitogen-activated protein kinase kinase n=1 Tax=Kingdonia uniflora TaxID=39325 RepID=A0A7J7NA03_9MAGN|nr:hypothetical protein GIB67_036178 [Kingdonia uniflora]